MAPKTDLIGVSDVARLLGCSEQTVRRIPALEAIRLPSGQRVFRRDVAERVAREREVKR